MEVVLGVEVEVGYVVSEGGHGGHAGGVAGGVGGTHVGWELADDVADGHFELGHFLAAVGFGEGGEVGVGPGVGGDLVLVGDHAVEYGGVGGCWVVDGALAVVDTGDVEGGFGVVGVEEVEESGGVDVGSVVVGEGDFTFIGTYVDVRGVGDRTEVGTCDGGGICAAGSDVCIASTVAYEAVGRLAVFLGCTLGKVSMVTKKVFRDAVDM